MDFSSVHLWDAYVLFNTMNETKASKIRRQVSSSFQKFDIELKYRSFFPFDIQMLCNLERNFSP